MTKYACMRCGAVFADRVGMCSVCFCGSFWPVPQSQERVIWTHPRRGIRKAREIRGDEGSPCVYSELGNLPKSWKMLVYGSPGAGKSIFAMVLGDSFPRGLFVAHEEGDDTLARKIQRLEISNLHVTDASRYTEVLQDIENLGGVDVLILDSLTSMGMGIEEFSLLSEKVDRLVGVAQITKGGEHMGTMSLAHYCDVVVRVDEMRAQTQKLLI